MSLEWPTRRGISSGELWRQVAQIVKGKYIYS